MICRVIAAWDRVYDPALRVRAQDQVTLEHQDDEWPGWVWCIPATGPAGWLPLTKLHVATGGTTAVARVDYDTRELTVTPGETLTRLDGELGWSRCAKPDGEIGWVPDRCLNCGPRVTP